MTVLEALLEVDRLVLSGLAAYDEICERALRENAALLRHLGHSDTEVAEIAFQDRERIRLKRGELHRELWTRALAAIAVDTDRCP